MADVAENLNALHKVVYNSGVPELVPNIALIQKDFSFEDSKKSGDYFEAAVRLALPNGFTHQVSDGTAGVYDLNDVKAGTQSKAKVYGYQSVLRDHLSYDDAAKATGDKQAYKEGTAFFFSGMQQAARKRLETQLLYGGVGIGKISTYTSGDPSVNINLADWAPGIWSGMKGCEIDVMNGSTSTVRASVTIAGIDIDNKKITLSTTVSGCAANDLIYFKGAYAKELLGIHKIMTNTGTLFNIDASVYELWKPNNVAITGALSFKAVKKAISKAVGKGLMDDILLYVNPLGWDDLAEDVMQLRTVDKSEVKKLEIGNEEIVYVSQNGKTVIKPHSMVKESLAYGLCKPDWHRIGACDFQLGIPGVDDGKPFFHIGTKAGWEARGFMNQAIYSESPGKSFYISGIVNTTA
jgi:hypothetical protein